MKILIVCPKLCHGGAERVAVSLANGFTERGHLVLMLSNLFDEITYNVSKEVMLSNLFSTDRNKLFKWLGAVRNIREYVRQERPDVISGIMELCSFIARLATVGIGVPVIATEHDAYERPANAPMPWGMKVMKFYVNRIYRKVTVLTEADAQIAKTWIPNVTVMPNPLAISLATNVPTNKEKIILAAGRVDNWYVKGFDILIRAWGKIASQFPGWTLQIAGIYKSPQTRVFLDLIASEEGISDRIQYLGFVNDMKTLFRKSSVFVLSSRYEGFGLVLIEAMSQGCVCVACDYKGRQREIITTDQEGLICEPDNAEALAETLKRLLEDKRLRDEIRQGALARSHYYSVENIIIRWEKLIEGVMKS